MSSHKNSGFIPNSSLKFFRGQLKAKSLTPEEELDLFRKYREGDSAARDRIILSHSKFIIKLAGRYSSLSLTFDDLLQEGYLGMMEALEKFDPAWNIRFLTFASRFAMGRMQNLVREVYASNYRCVSLFDKKGAETDLRFIDFLSACAPVLTTYGTGISESAEKLLAGMKIFLTENEYRILLHFFGIGVEGKQTLEDLSEKVNLSISRIHQIKKLVIVRLKKKLKKIVNG
ncbi:MAG: sigma-70 family RNA polymerase sigma factor [Ignavibacteriaceae bacterium]